jgi:hypothetical protein
VCLAAAYADGDCFDLLGFGHPRRISRETGRLDEERVAVGRVKFAQR